MEKRSLEKHLLASFEKNVPLVWKEDFVRMQIDAIREGIVDCLDFSPHPKGKPIRVFLEERGFKLSPKNFHGLLTILEKKYCLFEGVGEFWKYVNTKQGYGFHIIDENKALEVFENDHEIQIFFI